MQLYWQLIATKISGYCTCLLAFIEVYCIYLRGPLLVMTTATVHKQLFTGCEDFFGKSGFEVKEFTDSLPRW